MAQSRSPLKVFISHRASRCADCEQDLGTQAWIQLVNGSARCLTCADLDHLLFLAPGDAALTRRATRSSALSAIVLKWSKARKRYERQGILVEPAALEEAEAACLADADLRARRRDRATEQRDVLDAEYVAAFAARVRAAFPRLPDGREQIIAEHACAKYSGRVGRSAAAKSFDDRAIELAVGAHVRHRETKYDALLMSGIEVWEARKAIQTEVAAVLARWR